MTLNSAIAQSNMLHDAFFYFEPEERLVFAFQHGFNVCRNANNGSFCITLHYCSRAEHGSCYHREENEKKECYVIAVKSTLCFEK